MRAGRRTGSITDSARIVGVGAGSLVTAAEHWPPLMFPHRSAGPCTRYLFAALPPVATARRAIAACNVARYSES